MIDYRTKSDRKVWVWQRGVKTPVKVLVESILFLWFRHPLKGPCLKEPHGTTRVSSFVHKTSWGTFDPWTDIDARRVIEDSLVPLWRSQNGFWRRVVTVVYVPLAVMDEFRKLTCVIVSLYKETPMSSSITSIIGIPEHQTVRHYGISST